MEKTTKKRKKSRRMKRRIGLIAVGGLSFVLTICLSVGATLAWFAGSTWASNDLYMGGPVYVEMAGRGYNGVADGATTPADGENDADWRGGAGTLDIKASARDTGTADGQNANNNILLPGQKLLVYSQARVFSTLQTSTVEDGASAGQSSGANNSNTNDGTKKYYDGTGRVQTTTTSVLRAKFSINIEFDPSVGFNNFTDIKYAQGYPVQSTNYIGEYGTGATTEVGGGDTSSVESKSALTWASALGHTAYSLTNTISEETATLGQIITTTAGSRDAVANPALTDGTYDDTLEGISTTAVNTWVDGSTSTDLWQMKWGLSKSIYKWKYVSASVWEACGGDPETGDVDGVATANGIAIGAPFNGMYNTAGNASALNGGSGNGYYAVWEVVNTGTSGSPTYAKAESDAFYNARTSNYLKSYVEHYKDEYNRNLMMEIGSSLETLENALNQSFIDLISQSSDNIWAGNIQGFTAGTDGRIDYNTGVTGIPASWLYVDPKVGNDTNASDSASSVGGWWYLVENDAANGNKSGGNNTIITEIDNVVTGEPGSTTPTGATTVGADGIVEYNWGERDDTSIEAVTDNVPANAWNDPIEGTNFQRKEDQSASETTGEFVAATDKKILNAKLYEITPTLEDQLIATNPNDGTTTTKVVSYAFPFVNGNFELPGQAMTNIFANAKISFQITFQALQAFFPFSNSIDSIPSGTAITGTGKALNIGNAIPIYNEAFDYLSWL